MNDNKHAHWFQLFDTVIKLDGAMITLFEHRHPDVPAAFRAWCAARDIRCEHITTVPGGLYDVVGTSATLPSAISIHLSGSKKAA